MVLTDRQRADLHAGIYEYLVSQAKNGDEADPFARAAAALAEADPKSCTSDKATSSGGIPILEKKWTAVPRLQRKVLELERAAAQNAKIFAHRSGGGDGGAAGGAGGSARKMIPRPPATHTLQGHQGVVTCVAVHPVYTVAVSGSEDGTVKVWDHESGEYVRTLKGHTNTVHSLSFTATGSHLASASSDLSIKLWDFSTYSCIRTLRGHDHTISCIRFIPLPQSALAAQQSASSGGTATAGEATSSASGSTGIDVTLAGSSTLVSASRDETVKFWDVETGFCVHTLADHRDWVRAVAVRESDGELIATTGNDTVVIVYHATGDRKKVCELRGHEHVVESVAFVTAPAPASEAAKNRGKAPASEQKRLETVTDYLASGGRDRSVRLWSVSSASCLFVWTAHENWVRSVLIHPSGNYIISAGDDRSVKVFDIKSNRCLRTIEGAHSHFVTSVTMHHTLPIMVSGSVDQTLKCWQLD
uniref:Lissencephaly-1 homolog n=1 Tax=Odontella aurita TaxID=265563 RepID=A0A7S4MWN7_9STRA|mmetsp:Transcript_37055/g.110996  ORF Transcript_37055/g.110996 Transcript_37055/m.110996 type:complete len:474 (+) Transcript_37055:274-1695(+)